MFFQHYGNIKRDDLRAFKEYPRYAEKKHPEWRKTIDALNGKTIVVWDLENDCSVKDNEKLDLF